MMKQAVDCIFCGKSIRSGILQHTGKPARLDLAGSFYVMDPDGKWILRQCYQTHRCVKDNQYTGPELA